MNERVSSSLHIGYFGNKKSDLSCNLYDPSLLLLYCRYSPFLMACYNPETEEYQSVCRVMSGFSDAFYVEVIKMSEFCSAFFLPPFEHADGMSSYTQKLVVLCWISYIERIGT